MITKFDIDLVPHIKEYSAYVYRITITFKDGTKRIYIGGHKGSIYDSYDFSSKDEEFLKDLRNPDNKVHFEIVMKGNEVNMFDLENQMLEKVDAKNNPQYYNKTNGGSRYTVQSASLEEWLDTFIARYRNGEFDHHIKYLEVDYIEQQKKEHGSVQARMINSEDEKDQTVADDDYCRPIADEIDAKFGDTTFLPACLAFGAWGINKDGILWINGSQRENAVGMSKRGTTVKTVVLPKHEYARIAGTVGEITESMIDVGFLTNPYEAAPLPMKPKVLTHRIFDRSKCYDDIGSEATKRYLKKQGRGITDINKIISDAEALWKNKEKAESQGVGFIYHTNQSVEGKKIIDDAKKTAKKDYPNDIIWVYSSANFGSQMMHGEIQKPKIEGEKYPTVMIEDGKGKLIRPYIYHSNTDHQDEWERGKAEQVKQILKDLCKKYNFQLAPFDTSISLIAKGVVSKATK